MIYLDNAATSFPKPRRVTDEMQRCMRQYCGNPGRGSHALAMAAAEKIYRCRVECASFFGAGSPLDVCFTMNTTMALNTVIKGILQKGDHVLISDMEHNSVWRPVHRLQEAGIIEYDVFPTLTTAPDRSPFQICSEIARLVRPNTRMLICAHASNVCSSVLPLEEIGDFCRKQGILFVVDAAQSAGHLPIDVKKMKIDALCAPGHKGLLGPQGCGLFILREELRVNPLMEGGSGVHSLDPEMPEERPERYEAGTLPTPAIAGLLEGIREVNRLGVDQIGGQIAELNAYLLEQLTRIPSVTVYAPDHRGSILLFNKEGTPSETVGQKLSELGFCVRAGYHCSALGHATLATPDGGAVRVSPGLYNTRAQMDALADAIETV